MAEMLTQLFKVVVLKGFVWLKEWGTSGCDRTINYPLLELLVVKAH